MTEQPRKPRRTVLMTAGLTASVIAASLMGAQARNDEVVSPEASTSQYADPSVDGDQSK